jgi:mono/diheme cytochrome c family protein
MRLLLLALAQAFTVTAAAAQGTDSTHSTPGTKSVWQGAYAEEQASRGSNEHSTNCTSCHGTEKYTADAWAQNWVGRTVFDLYDQLRTTMPDDNPGGLSAQQYKDIVAYILKLNGLPAGTDSLPDDAEAMRLIKIDAKRDSTSLGSRNSGSGLLALFLQSAPRRSAPVRHTYHAHARTSPTDTR